MWQRDNNILENVYRVAQVPFDKMRPSYKERFEVVGLLSKSMQKRRPYNNF